MKKKRMVPYYQYIISLFCAAFLVGGGCYIYFDHRLNLTLKQNGIADENLTKVQNLYEEINNNYVGKVDKKKLVDGALKGMTDSLDDPYSTYLDKENSTKLNDSISGSFEGIGATLSTKDGLPTIVQAPIKESPAAKAGLKVNDVILKVNEKETKDKQLDEVVSEIRGKKGTKVKLTVSRADKIFDVAISRDTLPMETVSGEIDKKDASIGAIHITTFGENTYHELKTTIKSLRKQGATSFVLDLRQNPGGLLDQAEYMANLFLKDGKTIVKFEDRHKKMGEDVASNKLDKDGFKVKEPVVLLVDGGSASASEIFAAALHESAGVPIIGTKTYGKGTVQTVKDLKDDTEIKLTVLKWLTPNGTWIHKKGLKPTIEADYPEYAYLLPISVDKPLKLGENSNECKNANAILQSLNYDVNKESSVFSNETQQAVEHIQTKAQLPANGEIDSKTATVIEEKLREKILNNDRAYQAAVKELLTKKK
ncbi:S41 family peptidase [Melissococcus plutonius]|uniref:S41 family peptidase n=1 Tax=Melissococcus plutonius TaxID=33970 RepID=UPI0021E62422|nr:S41 family peptidase [Melissococcus plutonius]MCV2499187.1 S41 family peptidase [Melissococcus plutonius]MCV2500373.1 S41 family peptidase [Melissococcus plutonius]MCV2507692.1 S41 family peptidase [Melissococcus plutonius]MCV2527190.1 S41 family peptidase [Melissococcus plutonius]